MMAKAKRRKKRSDRAYLIYKVTCTVNLECYVGLVVRQGQAVKKTLRVRLGQHVARALGQVKGWEVPRNWLLHKAIRKHGATAFTIELLDVVRGKAAAHRQEIELMVRERTTLNTCMKRN